MKNTIWNKHIPTFLGIGLIIIGIAITSFLVKSGVIFTSGARPTPIPQNLKITNISDSSFTISYSTQDNEVGWVNLGKDKNLGLIVLDDRDKQAGVAAPHKIHSVTITNLTPETKYFFSITSGQETFLNNNIPIEVSTGPTIEPPSSLQNPISGKVILPDGNKPDEAIVYVTTEDAQDISILAKPDGSYELPLNSMRTKDLSSYYTLEGNSIIKILVASSSLTSNVVIYANRTSVPLITLSKDYDFTIGNEPIATNSAGLQGFSSILVASQSSSTKIPQILMPKKEQGFTDQQPQFRGTASPNEKVKIIIHSPEDIQTEVNADANGTWTYRPLKPLSTGRHTISIVTKDVFGILKTITQSFIIYPLGTQVAESATPSATPTSTPTPTTKPSPSPTPKATTTPTPTPRPTLTPTKTPTPTPTVSAAKPSPTPTIPPTGNSSVVTVGIVGIVITIVGILLFFLTRGGTLSL